MEEVDDERLGRILEAALLAAGRPLSIADLERLFEGDAERPSRDGIRRALAGLAEDWSGRSLVLQEVASGFRAQVRDEYEPWVARLWEEKPPRYSRALLETLAIIAYRQPVTRSEVEDIRGVSVSTQIMRTLQEREWVRVVGHREAPGRPAMYGTTRQFLDYFNLKTLDQLPPLAEVREMESRYPELAFEGEPSGAPGVGVEGAGDAAVDTPHAAGTAFESDSGGGAVMPEDQPPGEVDRPGPAAETGTGTDDEEVKGEEQDDSAGTRHHRDREETAAGGSGEAQAEQAGDVPNPDEERH
jgi:segregation and condensation protein B